MVQLAQLSITQQIAVTVIKACRQIDFDRIMTEIKSQIPQLVRYTPPANPSSYRSDQSDHRIVVEINKYDSISQEYLLRMLHQEPLLKPLFDSGNVTARFDFDHYVDSAARRRLILTFKPSYIHKIVNKVIDSSVETTAAAAILLQLSRARVSA